MASVALFVALGGTSYAVTQINGRNLKNRTISGSKIKRNTLSGTEIRESTVGKVPQASDADRVGGQAQTAFLHIGQASGGALSGAYPDPTLRCPADTVRQSDFCFEPSARSAASWETAAATCGSAGRRLGTPAELYSVLKRPDVRGVGEWTSTVYDFATGGGGATTQATYESEPFDGTVNLLGGTISGPLAYRCLVGAGNP